jgi:hypothetical protein
MACETEFQTDRQLHAHLRVHKLRMAEYYQRYYPRYDKHDGKIIKFKNKKYYFNTNFNSRTNLRMFLKGLPEEEAKKYCKELLIERKKEKNLKYLPTQVELRSIMSPPVQYYNELFGDYYRLGLQLGFSKKYKRFTDIVSGYEYQKPEYKILVDTREQRPLKFKRDIEIIKLDFGDYAFSNAEASCNCCIERKSLVDFIGTLSGGYERFQNEIKLAEDNNAYFVVLIESNFNNALYFNQKRKSHNGEKVFGKVRATPEFIFHRVRSLMQEHSNLQFLFVSGRKEASRVIEKIFTCGCVFKQIDLQLAYDLKAL